MTAMHEGDSGTEPEGAPAIERLHIVSMAVWDAPSVGVADRPTPIKVGAACSEGCNLAGRRVVVMDDRGAALGEGVLMDAAAGSGEGLAWTLLNIRTPAMKGVSHLTASLQADDGAHSPCATAFSLRIEPAPDSTVCFMVVSEATGKALEDCEVRLGRYFTYTDADGRARLDVSSGDYLCEIRKEGFAATPFNVPVSADLSLLIEAGKGETREELEARLSSMENHPWG